MCDSLPGCQEDALALCTELVQIMCTRVHNEWVLKIRELLMFLFILGGYMFGTPRALCSGKKIHTLIFLVA